MGCNTSKNNPQDNPLDLSPPEDDLSGLRESDIFDNLPMNDDDESVQTEGQEPVHNTRITERPHGAPERHSDSSEDLD